MNVLLPFISLCGYGDMGRFRGFERQSFFSNNQLRIIAQMNEIFVDVKGMHGTPSHQASSNQTPIEFVYGEITNAGFLSMFRQLRAKPGMKYYDLGSGSGKSPMIASLLGLDATGIEIVPKRYQAACTALARLKNSSRDHKLTLSYHLNSFLQQDFSNADIIFCNSVMWSPATMAQLSVRARSLKNGTKIVSFKRLDGPEFKSIGQIPLAVSWVKRKLPFYVQQKMSSEDQFIQKNERFVSNLVQGTKIPSSASCQLQG